jgi:ribosome-interacting GTPase 1
MVRLPTLLLANHCDRVRDPEAELAALRELAQLSYPALAVSAATGHGLGDLGPWLFRRLGIVRVYTKAPGKPPDHGRPFTLQRGQTVRQLARLVHQDLERSLRFARVWGDSGFDGQHVGADHALTDGDIVELHT